MNASDGGVAASEYIISSPPSAHAPPIHSLPPELLGETFILALPTDEEFFEWSKMIDPQPRPRLTTPFTFCAVCSLWRSLGFSTPRLWQQVFVYVSRRTGEHQARRKALDLVQWINRARLLPLTLYILCSPGSVSFANDEGSLAPIVSVLNNYATRWKFLYLQSLRKPWNPSLSRLFHFDGWHTLRGMYLRKPFDLLRNKTIPWAQLTHLQIWTCIAVPEAMSVFRMCSKLVELSVHASEDSYLVMGADHITTHDLVTFSVSSYRLSVILEGLSLPSLRNLRIVRLSTRDVPPLLNLFTRSSCTLDKLELGELCFRPTHYLSLLSHESCNLLTSLRIRGACGSSIDAEVLRRLTLHQNDSLCRRLKFLKIDCCTESSSSALLKMAESRIRPHAGQLPEEQLQHFRFCIEPHDNIEELDEFGKKNGMKYKRQTLRCDLDLVSLWRFGSGFETMDPRSTLNDIRSL